MQMRLVCHLVFGWMRYKVVQPPKYVSGWNYLLEIIKRSALDLPEVL